MITQETQKDNSSPSKNQEDASHRGKKEMEIEEKASRYENDPRDHVPRDTPKISGTRRGSLIQIRLSFPELSKTGIA